MAGGDIGQCWTTPNSSEEGKVEEVEVPNIFIFIN